MTYREKLLRDIAVEAAALRGTVYGKPSAGNGYPLKNESPARTTSRLVLTNWQSPGDLLMLSAAVRDLHKAYPGRYTTDLRTSCDALWEHSPYVTRFPEPWIDELAAKARDAGTNLPIERDGVTAIPMHYGLIHQSNQGPYHFIEAFHRCLSDALGIPIPVTAFCGDIHLADVEKQWMSQVAEMGVSEKFWLVMSGGKWDFTAKWPNPDTMQAVVDRLMGRVLFAQIGTAGNWEPPLRNVIDLIAQTDMRMLIRLIYHSVGILTPLNGIMHLAAAVPTPDGRTRPCVVLAGGREPTHWEAYPTHRYLSTQGALPCCHTVACWKSRSTPVNDGDAKDGPEQICQNFVEYPAPRVPLARQQPSTLRIAKCIDMISADEIIRAIESYYEGGVLTWAK